MPTATIDPLSKLPDPVEIHRRLGELARERRLLRQTLRLALAAREERTRRSQPPERREVADAS